jgi:hypothetical protein
MGCKVVVSGVVLHPEMPTNAATGKIQISRLIFMCASTACPNVKGFRA